MKLSKWDAKQARELFCKTVNSYIIKAGSEKDPIIDTVLEIAKKTVDKAFELYQSEDKEEKFEFEEKVIEQD